ncbi:MAG: histidine kinase [Saprospiraceae bacterium]|nr:histidine kinase [Saprospiraceae bacterium]
MKFGEEERLRTDFEKQIANIEMNALRAQMNPHFIFNCLNSIDRYIITNNTKKASEYLNHFGRLIRLILQNSRSNYVNLKDELEALELYLKLEQMRFRHSFDYEINIPPDINPENYEIPPMLIQPYVENAIWHGLNHKDEKGKVSISISINNDIVTCVIEDDGIGRMASKAMMKAKEIKRQSMGMNITSERMAIINKIHDTNNNVRIIDLYDESNKPKGTQVVLNISL